MITPDVVRVPFITNQFNVGKIRLVHVPWGVRKDQKGGNITPPLRTCGALDCTGVAWKQYGGWQSQWRCPTVNETNDFIQMFFEKFNVN